MKLSKRASTNGRSIVASLLLVGIVTTPVSAITAGQISDFQDGTAQGWGIGFGPLPTVPDGGPAGAGDFALFMSNSTYGNGRLLVIADPEFSGAEAAAWMGDWTAAGITQIQLDVKNSSDFELFLRLGIAGPLGGPFGGGGGDTHVTEPLTVPVDDQWHTITFDVAAANFISVGGLGTPAGALADVTHLRILHNPDESFIGTFDPGTMLFDNILAIGPDMGIPGDYNANGVVDAADYTVWRDTFGATGAGLAADGTGPAGSPDGVVDDLDYNFWKANFGSTTPGSGAGVVGTAVPEPASSLLLAAATAYAQWRRRRSR